MQEPALLGAVVSQPQSQAQPESQAKAQSEVQPPSQNHPADQPDENGQSSNDSRKSKNDRMFFVMPNFLTVGNESEVAPISWKEKFKITAQGSFDPYEFAVAGVLAGIRQAEMPTRGSGRASRDMPSAMARPSPIRWTLISWWAASFDDPQDRSPLLSVGKREIHLPLRIRH